MADIDITLDNSDANRKIRQTGQALTNTGKRGAAAGDQIADTWRKKVNKQFFESRRQLRDMRSTFSEIALGFGITIFARQLFEVNNRLISARNALSAFSGSVAQNERELKAVSNLSQEYGLDLLVMSENYTKLRAATAESSLSGSEMFQVFKDLSGAARVLNLDYRRTEGVFRAVIQMFSKGRVQAEELRGQLGEHIPGAFFLAAKAMKVTAEELDKMISLGQVTADELIPALGRVFRETFGIALPAAINTASAEFERMKNALKIMVKANQDAIDESFATIFGWAQGAIQIYAGLILSFSKVFSVIAFLFTSWGGILDAIWEGIWKGIFQTAEEWAFKLLKLIETSTKDTVFSAFGTGARAANEFLFGGVDPAIANAADPPKDVLKELSKVFNTDIPREYKIMLANLELQSTAFKKFLLTTFLFTDKIPPTEAPFDEIKKGLIDPNRPLSSRMERNLAPVLSRLAVEKKINQTYIKRRQLIIANTHLGSTLRNELLIQNEMVFDKETRAFEAKNLRMQSSIREEMGLTASAVKATFEAASLELMDMLKKGLVTLNEFTALSERRTNDAIVAANPFLAGLEESLGSLTAGFGELRNEIIKTFGEIGSDAVKGFADAISGAIVNGENLGITMGKVFRTMAKEVISSLIQIAARMIINFILSKTIFAAAAAASNLAAIEAAAAWTPAAYMANVATLGGAAAIGMSSLLGGLAVSQIAAVGAATAGSALSFGGAAAHGSKVHPNKFYEVGEEGPEVFRNKAGREYLIPGVGGAIDPLKRINSSNTISGNGEPNVIVNIHGAPEGTTVTRTQGSDGTEIDIFIAKLDRAMATGILEGTSEMSGALSRLGVDRSRGVY